MAIFKRNKLAEAEETRRFNLDLAKYRQTKYPQDYLTPKQIKESFLVVKKKREPYKNHGASGSW